MEKALEFECNITENDFYDNLDNSEIEVWGAAFIWDEKNNIGAEYNFSIDMTTDSMIDCSAIYKSEIDYNGNLCTDYNTFIYYEIDFKSAHWKEKLRQAMYAAFIEFHKNKIEMR